MAGFNIGTVVSGVTVTSAITPAVTVPVAHADNESAPKSFVLGLLKPTFRIYLAGDAADPITVAPWGDAGAGSMLGLVAGVSILLSLVAVGFAIGRYTRR